MIEFRKMHGLGNDFVILDLRHKGVEVTPDIARLLCDRRHGIGCDQLIAIAPGEGRADAVMLIWNPDGSRSGACGNATRCVADILMRESGAAAVTIETAFGVLPCRRADDGMVTAGMGVPLFGDRDIPLARPLDAVALSEEIVSRTGVAVLGLGVASMGNPHLTLFVEDAEAVPIERLGPMLEHHDLFPERANIEICSVSAADTLRLRVWERGAGVTLACGSGTCAAVATGVRLGLTGRETRVQLDGGMLSIKWSEDGMIWMTGPVSYAFSGIFDQRPG